MTDQPTGTSRRSFLRLASIGGATVAAAAALAACGSGSSSSSASATPVSGGTLKWGAETEPKTLNPQLSTQDAVRPQLRNVFDSYLAKDAKGGYHPWLASAYEVSSDGKTVTLTLKDGVTFSDGATLDAAAVVKNFDTIQSDDYEAGQSSSRAHLKAWKQGKDSKTVVFTLTQPDDLFLDYLATPGSAPLSPASLKSSSLKSGGKDIHGTGPFTIASYQQGQKLVLKKRSDYKWAPESITGRQGAAYLDSIEISYLSEASARIGALQSGQVDIIDGVPAQYVSQFSGTSGFSYERILNPGVPYNLHLNTSKDVLKDVEVRRAIQQGADYSAIVKTFYKGVNERAWGPVSSASAYYDSARTGAIEFDKDAANKALDKAGWKTRDSAGYRTKDGKRLTIRTASNTAYLRDSRDSLNLAIADALKKNIGVEYTYRSLDSGSTSEVLDANDYEVYDQSYSCSDIAQGLDVFYNSDPEIGDMNYMHAKDAQLTEWLNTARKETDTAKREAIYKKVQKRIVEDLALIVPIYIPRNSEAAGSKTHGVVLDKGLGNIFGAYNIFLTA